MSGTPFLQFYAGDYLADTLELTTEQHGAYLLLLLTMWRHKAKLPYDIPKLARITRLSPARFKRIWPDIAHYFTVEDGFIRNKKLSEQHEKVAEISAKRADVGRKGGEAKALKSKEPEPAIATDLPSYSQNHNQNHTEDKIESADAASKPMDRESELAAMPPVGPTPKPKEQEITPAREAFNRYTEMASRKGWPVAASLTDRRRKAINARLAEAGGVEGWIIALEKAAHSEFLGQPSPFKSFGLDWIAKPDNFAKIMEGNYDDRDTPTRPDRRGAAADDAFAKRIRAAAQIAGASREDRDGH